MCMEKYKTRKAIIKEELQRQLDKAHQCLNNFEKLKDQQYQQSLLKGAALQSIFDEHRKYSSHSRRF